MTEASAEIRPYNPEGEQIVKAGPEYNSRACDGESTPAISENGKEIEETEGNAWKPGTGEWLIILCLCVVSLVVALDATILVPALPVRLLFCYGITSTNQDLFNSQGNLSFPTRILA